MPRCADCGWPEEGYMPDCYFRQSRMHGKQVCSNTAACLRRQKRQQKKAKEAKGDE